MNEETPPWQSALAALQESLTTLESRLATENPSAKVTALESQLATIQATLDRLQNTPPAADPTPKLTELEAKLSALAAKLEPPTNQPPPPNPAPDAPPEESGRPKNARHDRAAPPLRPRNWV